MSAEDIVSIIMTQHWDMAACMCWVCKEGREAGLYPTSYFEDWRDTYPIVEVRR